MTDLELTTAIANIADNTPNTALEMRNILVELMRRGIKKDTVVMKQVTNSYIATNFDVNGLGILEEEGYRIATDFGGRVPVGFNGAKYNNMGATGGAELHQLTIDEMPRHRHKHTGSDEDDGNWGAAIQEANNGYVGDRDNGMIYDAGGDQPHNNMQPFVVTLFTIKL